MQNFMTRSPKDSAVGHFFISYVFLFVSMSLLFTACDKDTPEIGSDLQPGDDQIDIMPDISLSPEIQTFKDDSIASDERSFQLLGAYNDPDFGKAKAEFITQLTLSSGNINTDTDISVDSVYIHLVYAGYYGDTTTDQTFNIHKIVNRELYYDSTYYSNLSLNTSEFEQFKDFNYTPQLSDTTLSIDITNENWISFFENPSNYSDNETLRENIQGLYFSCDYQDAAVVYFDLLSENSKLRVYYNDSSSFDILFSGDAARINLFEHNYNPVLESVIQDTLSPEEYAYLQAGAGTKVKLRVPDSAVNLLEDKAINRAQLKITINSSSSSSDYLPPEELFLVAVNDEGLYEFLTDYKVSDVHFGGQLDEIQMTYTFNIPLYIQDLLSEDISNENGLYLFPLDNRVSMNRTIINGNNHAATTLLPTPLQINIVYSEY